MDPPSFMQAYSGNIASLATFSGIYLVWYLVTKKCKHSKCASHTSWWDCSASEDEIERQQTERETKMREDILLELYRGALRVGGVTGEGATRVSEV